MIYRWITWIILYLWWLSSFSLWHLNQVQGCWKEAELSQGHTCKVKSLGVGCLCVCVCMRQRDTEKDRDRFNSQVKLQSAFFFFFKESFAVCLCVLSCFSCVRLFATPWTAARQAPLSMGFSTEEYGSVAMPSSRGTLLQR